MKKLEKSKNYFLDTNAILFDFTKYKTLHFAISDETLRELEDIKTNKNKTEDVRAAARSAIRWLATHVDEYEVVFNSEGVSQIINNHGCDSYASDMIICGCAYFYKLYTNEHVTFVTHDLSCRNIAEKIFGLDVEWLDNESQEEYKGFKEFVVSNDVITNFCGNTDYNKYDLLTNEYLILRNEESNIVDAYRWTGEKHEPIYKKPIKSLHFNKLQPKDIYQSCVIDSIMHNTITAISGKAGTGKSLISLVTIQSMIEASKPYDRFICLFNPIKARGTADLGYYAGDFLTKAMLNSVGNILTTKYGDRCAVDLLLSQEKIKLVSMADCRGMEIRDNEILYIPEAENTTVDMMKLCLSRVSSGAKVIIEGDPESQVDSFLYEGTNNGLNRVVEKFKGKQEFGYIQLQNIWRSKLAQLAETL